MTKSKFFSLAMSLAFILNNNCQYTLAREIDLTDTKNWLNDSLSTKASSSNTALNQTKLAQVKTVSDKNKVKLMPFVPGRKLPHKEVSRPLEPEMDTNSSVLQGGVTLTAQNKPIKVNRKNQWRIKKASDETSVNNKNAEQNAEQNVDVTEIKQLASKACNGIISKIMLKSKTEPGNYRNFENFANLNNGSQSNVNNLIQGPSLGLSTMTPMNNLVMNSPSSGDADSDFAAGPPPFPLNLIPANMLKQIIYNKPKNNVAFCSPQASYFGSWHQASGVGLPNGSKFYDSISRSNLPSCSFHSNLNYLAYNHLYNSKYSSHIYRSLVYNANRIGTNNSRLVQVTKHNNPSVNAPFVACYPPYAHSHNFE